MKAKLSSFLAFLASALAAAHLRYTNGSSQKSPLAIRGNRHSGKYTGVTNGKREVSRRLRQIAAGKLQVSQ